jgi:D-sedoheptulose 7-phosphate isomerase
MQLGRIEELVDGCIRRSIAVKETIVRDQSLLSLLAEVGLRIAEAVQKGRKVILFGNGGSAADAQHLAAEFTGRFLRERKPLPALALTVNTSSLTAIANDYSFDQVFARQVQALGAEGDVAVGITTSGTSRNVLNALDCARRMGLITVALTGDNQIGTAGVCDYCIRVPSVDTPRIQEAHIMIGHILCQIVEMSVS